MTEQFKLPMRISQTAEYTLSNYLLKSVRNVGSNLGRCVRVSCLLDGSLFHSCGQSVHLWSSKFLPRDLCMPSSRPLMFWMVWVFWECLYNIFDHSPNNHGQKVWCLGTMGFTSFFYFYIIVYVFKENLLRNLLHMWVQPYCCQVLSSKMNKKMHMKQKP